MKLYQIKDKNTGRIYTLGEFLALHQCEVIEIDLEHFSRGPFRVVERPKLMPDGTWREYVEEFGMNDETVGIR